MALGGGLAIVSGDSFKGVADKLRGCCGLNVH
jgi:hypothetical protein